MGTKSKIEKIREIETRIITEKIGSKLPKK